MGDKDKSRCYLGVLKVNNLWLTNFTMIKKENCAPIGECLQKNDQTLQKLYFSFFFFFLNNF